MRHPFDVSWIGAGGLFAADAAPLLRAGPRTPIAPARHGKAGAVARSGWTSGAAKSCARAERRAELPVGPLYRIIDGSTRGRPWSGAAGSHGSTYREIDPDEISSAGNARRAAMLSASAGLRLSDRIGRRGALWRSGLAAEEAGVCARTSDAPAGRPARARMGRWSRRSEGECRELTAEPSRVLARRRARQLRAKPTGSRAWSGLRRWRFESPSFGARAMAPKAARRCGM
jgi:hypothetical protein